MQPLRGCEMPLPNAEPVENSRLYQELKVKTAFTGVSGGITADLMDSLKNAQFVEGNQEDELRRIRLIQEVTNTTSSSGPFPDTSKIDVASDITASGGTATFSPAGLGEVWRVIGASYVIANGSGSYSFQLYLDDGSATVIVSEKASSDAADNFGDVDYNALFLDQNMDLKCTIYGTFGATTTISVKLATIRVR